MKLSSRENKEKGLGCIGTWEKQDKQRRVWGLWIVSAMIFGIWIVGWRPLSGASQTLDSPKERWVFTTKSHFSWYALLSGAPIYRDQIRSVHMDTSRVYLTVALGQSGILFSRGPEVQILALDRREGYLAWKQRFPFNGYPIAHQLISVGNRLVAALFEGEEKQLVILAMDLANGNVIWRANLPKATGPTLVGDEATLSADFGRETVIINILGNKQRRQLTFRAKDGVQVSDVHYRGYVWHTGPIRAAGLNLGYEGSPTFFGLRKYEQILAFDESTGQLEWSLPLVPLGASLPTVYGSSLFIANGDQLLQVNLRNGQIGWKAKLDGRVQPDAEPPAVINTSIAVAHRASADPQDRQWKMSIYQLADGTKQTQVAIGLGDFYFPSVLRQVENFLVVGSTSVLQVFHVQNMRLMATLALDKMLSSFVYSDPPSMRVADSDSRGFAVVTTDGKLRYYSAEDFQDSRADASSSMKQQSESRTPNLFSVLFYFVVNPLWDSLHPGRRAFWVLFYGLPFLLLGLVGLWRPLWGWLQRVGISRAVAWGASLGVFCPCLWQSDSCIFFFGRTCGMRVG